MEELDPNILELLKKFKKNSTKKINTFLIKEPVVETTSVKKNNSNLKLNKNLDTNVCIFNQRRSKITCYIQTFQNVNQRFFFPG